MPLKNPIAAQAMEPTKAPPMRGAQYSSASASTRPSRPKGPSTQGPANAIARNTAINFLTRRRHQPLAVGGSGQRRIVEAADPESEASGQFDLEYRRELFRWSAERLRDVVSEKTWAAFWRTSVEEQPIEAVARELKMSVGSVYIARCRVMARLRELVRSFEETER